MAAHLRSLSVELVLSASERCLAPSAPMSLPMRLRVRAHSERQRPLTLKNVPALAVSKATIWLERLAT